MFIYSVLLGRVIILILYDKYKDIFYERVVYFNLNRITNVSLFYVTIVNTCREVN